MPAVEKAVGALEGFHEVLVRFEELREGKETL